MDRFCVILKKDLVAGEEFFFCQYMMLCEKLDVLFGN